MWVLKFGVKLSCKTSINDLAIFGGEPAFTEPLHVGQPTIANREAFLRRVNEILDSSWFTNNGPMVQELERRIAGYLGVKHCIAICNGTIALQIAIRALDLKGEVVVPSYTFVATAHALQWEEITPVFADIAPATHNLDPASVEQMITPRTTGIMGVHLWGRPAPIDELTVIANRHKLSLMFDASHAFGCTYRGNRIGQFGRCEVFSFHATKVFNTFEGGAIVTNDDEMAGKVRLMKNFGFSGYDNVIYLGTNGKMPEICAAMGLTGLDGLKDAIEHNRKNYMSYRNAIAKIPGLSLAQYDEQEKCNYQYVVIEVSDKCPLTRDELVKVLHAENVLARKYFWPGCHNMSPYREYYPNAGMLLPNTNAVAGRVIVMPTGASVSARDIERIILLFRNALSNSTSVKAQIRPA